MKKISSILVLGMVGVCCGLVFGQPVFAKVSEQDLAQTRALLKEKISSEAIKNCSVNLSSAYDLELFDFLQFLETNFQNKSANSSLTNIAIARYSDYKRTLNSLFQELRPDNINGTSVGETTAYIDCISITDAYVKVGKDKLIEQVKKTAGQKQATVILEKYQAINSKLRDLNLAVAQMYGYFMSFKEKLPGFLKECIQI